MNRVLMKLIVDTAVFLGLSQEEEVSAESARDFFEYMGTELQDLTQEERKVFVQYIEEQVVRWQDNGTDEQTLLFLSELPERLALVPTKSQRYYLVSYGGNLQPRQPDQELEVQVLDSLGRARMVGYIGRGDTDLVIKGHVVPSAVLETARHLEPGYAVYVDIEGQIIDPLLATRELLKSTRPQLP